MSHILNYTIVSRDSSRYAQVVNIYSSLELYGTKKSLPKPDNYVEIQDSSNTLAYQWYAGEDVLRIVEYSNGGINPKDKNFFTYFVSEDGKSLQMLALMEEPVKQVAYSSITPENIFPKTQAADYSQRYPFVYGKKLWVLLDESNTPIQELGLPDNKVSISDVGTLWLKSFLSTDEYVEGSGTNFSDLYSIVPEEGKLWGVKNNKFFYKGPWKKIDKNCDLDDITIAGITWAGCNSTLWDGFEWGINVDGSPGVINTCYPLYTTSSNTTNCDASNPALASNAKANTWFSGTNNYGDSEFNTIWGKLYTWEQAAGVNGYTWACPPGWKLPSQEDITTLTDYLVAQNGGWNIGWRQHNTKNDENNLANVLKIPLSGQYFTYLGNSNFWKRWRDGSFWSSSTHWEGEEEFWEGAHVIVRLANMYQSPLIWATPDDDGYGVRCIKDL